jgi:CHRD domain-containing protein
VRLGPNGRHLAGGKETGIMTTRLGRMALAASLLALAAPAAHAARTKTFIAVLNGGQETPPTSSNSIGVALITFDEKAKTLCYAISFNALDGRETAAHIHGPAAIGQPAQILFGLPTGNPKTGCTSRLSGAQKKALKQGLLYVNIHSVPHVDGEIRGQLLPVGR